MHECRARKGDTHVTTNERDTVQGEHDASLQESESQQGRKRHRQCEHRRLDAYLKENWDSIKERIEARKYKPKPVLRVEIPKPGGGVRKLGIPTVVDRIIVQAIVELLEYLNDGYTYIVDTDLEKFFDKVPQDKLMTLVGNTIKDPDTESLIAKYLKAGVMVKGKYETTEKGTPQGGNLSPILRNIMLNELDKELEARGLNVVRYADDCVITLKSSDAANRVMRSVTKWIERTLGLKVNAKKTKVTKRTRLKYLGFSFTKMGDTWEARPHQDSVKQFKRKLKQLTKRSWSISLTERIRRLNWVIRGWINYFRMGRMKTHMKRIDERLRTRMRIVIWKQWKTRQKRLWGLLKLGVPEWLAKKSVGFHDHYQAVAKTGGLRRITKQVLARRGLISCADYYLN